MWVKLQVSPTKHCFELVIASAFTAAVCIFWIFPNFCSNVSPFPKITITNEVTTHSDGSHKPQSMLEQTTTHKWDLATTMKSPETEEQVKRILWWSTVYGGKPAFFGIGSRDSDMASLKSKCKSNLKCEFTVNKSLLESSHGIIFHGWGDDLPTQTIIEDGKEVVVPKNAPPQRYKDQIYIYMTLEAPTRVRTDLQAYKNFFNWTINYRLDSDFVCTYGHSKKKSPQDAQFNQLEINSTILTSRPNPVAWMVSNCNDAPSGRMKLAEELQKYIPVNIYGKCGPYKCNSTIDPDCWKELAMTHKFYLSFENSLCKDYVTEKFFNALNANMVPVVYGRANYALQFPPGSFINVDSFGSAKALAEYLKYLDKNDEEYLRYFDWRKHFRVVTYWPLEEAYCGACERLHRENPLVESVIDIGDWLFRNNSDNPICVGPSAQFQE